MPPRSGQLDQISEAIGELKGSIKGIEKYVHEERHGVHNLSQKFDALGLKIAGDIAAVEARIDIRMEAMSTRIANLETVAAKAEERRSVAVWFLQSPLIGWMAAGVMLFIAWWKKP